MSEGSRFTLVAAILLTQTTLVYCVQGQGQASGGPPAAGESTKTRTQMLKDLDLRAAQIDLEHAKEAYDRYKAEHEEAQTLFQKGIMSRKELDEAVSAYARASQQLKQAEILLEKTKLGFLSNATHITVVEAKKYYNDEGRRMLDLLLRNTSSLSQAEIILVPGDPNGQPGQIWQTAEQIRALLDIENIIISIVKDSASIGKPYEEILPLLPYGQQKKVTFELLTDVEHAGVKLQYLNQSVTNDVYLEKESLQEIPTIVASQFSLEGELGTDVRYDITLEMLVTSDRNFSLAVTNMPPQINCCFLDSSSGSRITSVRFTQMASKHTLSLRASIPSKLDVGMIDKRIDFQVWVATSLQMESIDRLQSDPNAERDRRIDSSNAGRVDLSLVPKGSARLEILIDNLYTEIKPGQIVDVEMELHNSGTLELFDLATELELPTGWKSQIDPMSIPKLLPEEKRRCRIRIELGTQLGAGEYEVQVAAKGQNGGTVAEAIEKRLKVRVNAPANVAVTLSLIGGVLLCIFIIVVLGVKLSRR